MTNQPSDYKKHSTHRLALVIIGLVAVLSTAFFVLLIVLNPPSEDESETLSVEDRVLKMTASNGQGNPEEALIFYRAALNEDQYSDELARQCAIANDKLQQYEAAKTCLNRCTQRGCVQLNELLDKKIRKR